MKKNTSRNKMQRKVASRRKKWTNAERFANKQKNLLRLAITNGANMANRLIKEAEEEIMQEHEHKHDESCKHE